MTEADETAAWPESTRVEAFSDGVFAIAITLLVLDLHDADGRRGGFAHALLEQWPSYVAYLAAFTGIAAIWINHHDLFTRVRGVDAPLMCANLGLLLVASLFPWPAAVVSAAIRDGNHGDQVSAVVLYAAVGFLVPLAWISVYHCLSRRPHLVHDPATFAAYARTGIRRSLVSVAIYPLAAVLGLFSPLAALIAFAVLPPFFIATLLWSDRRVG